MIRPCLSSQYLAQMTSWPEVEAAVIGEGKVDSHLKYV
jgi:hypothetical protein